jgi:hypothetical protein
MICLGPSAFGAAVKEAQCARSPGIQAFLRGVVLSSSPGCSFLFRPPATLFDLFKISAEGLAGSQSGGAPFRIILSLAIDLANDSRASEEALTLIKALEAFDDVPKDEQLVEALRSNGLTAHRTVLQKNLFQTAQAERNRQSARLAQQLCAHCCSALSAAQGSSYAAGIQQELDEWESLTDTPARPPGSRRTARAFNSGDLRRPDGQDADSGSFSGSGANGGVRSATLAC